MESGQSPSSPVRRTGTLSFLTGRPAQPLAVVKDENTGKTVATAIGHISAIGPAIMVLETPEQILEMVGLDYQRIVPTLSLQPLHKPS